MTGDVVAVVLFILKVYVCQAENVIIGSTKQLVCLNQSGNGWDKFSHGPNMWGIINDGGSYSGSQSNTLTITNFQIEDSGYFRCKVDGNVVAGDNTQLKPEVQASIGTSVILTCTVPGTPLYWYMIGNNGVQTLSDNLEYDGSRTNSLKIRFLTAKTAFIHYCQPIGGMKGPEITVSISGWSSWNAWSACNVECGGGQRERSRTCPGGNCTGRASKNDDCTVVYGVDGRWSAWSTSGICTVSSGGGSQPRVCHCNNPPPDNCGLYCNGKDNDHILCSPSACPVNGGWSAWDSCIVICGNGQQSRRRSCNNPAPQNGLYCQGQGVEYNKCTFPGCQGD
ncbi:unnamed protein product [Mytilus edulis]|uniref:Ig-like domain-containing protein n=1 Tax=Mytilus edulis TaxID=6550 RepID=A0A8S3T408_MYTED|nr:unnamed protein product [Mytilus edulis]